MSYKPGDLKITGTGDAGSVIDSRGPTPWSFKEGAYLEHSCEEWYIGGHAELLALLRDVVDAIGKARCTSRVFSPDGGDLCGGPVKGSTLRRLVDAFPELYQHRSVARRVAREISDATGIDVPIRRLDQEPKPNGEGGL